MYNKTCLIIENVQCKTMYSMNKIIKKKKISKESKKLIVKKSIIF